MKKIYEKNIAGIIFIIVGIGLFYILREIAALIILIIGIFISDEIRNWIINFVKSIRDKLIIKFPEKDTKTKIEQKDIHGSSVNIGGDNTGDIIIKNKEGHEETEGSMRKFKMVMILILRN